MRKKILLGIAILLIAGTAYGQLFQLGNADRTYQNVGITCYLGQLFPGQPIYWCMYPDGSMDHSWFVYQSQDMERYYSGGMTSTYTAQPEGR